MKRQLIASLAISLTLALSAGAVAYAADDIAPSPDASAVVAPTPTDDATTTPGPTAGGGEISIDPPFVTPTPDATPSSEVLGAAGRPELTPPPTDAVGGRTTAPGSGVAVLLLLAIAATSLMLLAGRLPVARRR